MAASALPLRARLMTAPSRSLFAVAVRFPRTNSTVSSSSSTCRAMFSASQHLMTTSFATIRGGGGSGNPNPTTSSSRRSPLSSWSRNHHPRSPPSIQQTTLLSSSSKNTTTSIFAQQRHFFSFGTPPLHKIYSMNTDLPTSEIQKIIDDEVAKIAQDKLTKEYRDWKPGMRKRPLVMSYRLEDFEEEASGIPSRWNPGLNKRCGALGIKLGMMPLWDNWGERHPCTVLFLDSNVVLRNKTRDSKEGYDAVQIGAGERKAKNVTKPLMGQYAQWGVDEHPPYIVREFRVTSKEAMPPPGTRIHARHFVPGQNVDIAGISKGKGFQGGMKRHGFKGMPASHGTSLSHRAIGSTGMCQDPGRVFKGKKMPGRMGGVRVTKQNLRIVKIDRGRNLLYIRGAVPGNKGEFVEIRDAVKRPLFGTDKCEGGKDSAFPPLPTFLYEEGVDGSGLGGYEVMMPMQEQDPLEVRDDEAA